MALKYACLVALAICQASAGNFSWADTKAMIVFGDSYSYVQGVPYGHQNYSFIGDYLTPNYTPDQLLSSRIIQNITSTAEGGPNWVEFLTNCGLDPVTPTDPQSCDKQLWNFAFAGADISLDYTVQHHDYTIPFVNQTSLFRERADPVISQLGWTKDEALVTVWIGINDISDTARFTNVTSFTDLYDQLHDIVFDAVETDLYESGYRNFLFMNLPPLDRRPGATAASLPNKTMVDWFDASLNGHVKSFQDNHTDATAMLFNVNAALNRVIDNASSYGILNTTGYCASYNQPYVFTDPGWYDCLPQSQYIWFNTGHLTSFVHSILGPEVESFLESQ